MKKLIIAGMLFFISNLFSHAWAVSPSFDCAKASQRVERIICKSDKLARQDLKLSKLYGNVLDKLTDDLKVQVKSEQRDWLKREIKPVKYVIKTQKNVYLSFIEQEILLYRLCWRLIRPITLPIQN